MTPFEQNYLSKIPTKKLLKAFQITRMRSTQYFYDNEGNLIDVRTVEKKNDPVVFYISKFSKFNPHKGKGITIKYSLDEVKQELNTREHIVRK